MLCTRPLHKAMVPSEAMVVSGYGGFRLWWFQAMVVSGYGAILGYGGCQKRAWRRPHFAVLACGGPVAMVVGL